MSKPWLLFLGGLLGGAGGSYLYQTLLPAGGAGPAATIANDDAAIRAIREEIAALRREMTPPRALAAPVSPGSSVAGPGLRPDVHRPSDGSASGGSFPGPRTLSDADVEAIASRAADVVAERGRAAPSEATITFPEKRKVTVAELAKELDLSSVQEDEVRSAYREAGEKFLEAFAENGDAAGLRRELEAAKDDPAKKVDLTTKMMPKLFSNLGTIMKIDADRKTRIKKSVGEEKAKKIEKDYKVADADPYDLESSFSFGDE